MNNEFVMCMAAKKKYDTELTLNTTLNSIIFIHNKIKRKIRSALETMSSGWNDEVQKSAIFHTQNEFTKRNTNFVQYLN